MVLNCRSDGLQAQLDKPEPPSSSGILNYAEFENSHDEARFCKMTKGQAQKARVEYMDKKLQDKCHPT